MRCLLLPGSVFIAFLSLYGSVDSSECKPFNSRRHETIVRFAENLEAIASDENSDELRSYLATQAVNMLDPAWIDSVQVTVDFDSLATAGSKVRHLTAGDFFSLLLNSKGLCPVLMEINAPSFHPDSSAVNADSTCFYSDRIELSDGLIANVTPDSTVRLLTCWEVSLLGGRIPSPRLARPCVVMRKAERKHKIIRVDTIDKKPTAIFGFSR